MRKERYVALVIAAMALGCGEIDLQQEEDQPENQATAEEDEFGSIADFDTATLASADESVEDEELAGQSVAAQVDVAAGSLTNIEISAEGSFAFGQDSKIRAKRHRVCEEEGDTAIVLIKRGIKREVSVSRRNFKRSAQVRSGAKIKRTWSREDGQVTCADNGKHADLSLETMAGVQLDVEFMRARDRKAHFEIADRARQRHQKISAKGKRQIRWLAVNEGENELTIDKEITSSVTRKMQAKNKGGKHRLLEMEIATKDQAPLATTVVRDLASKELKSRTITSGTLVATGKRGARVETNFDNVKWIPENGCMPVSGSVHGALFKPGATDPHRTYDISFNGETAQVVFDDGKEFEYTPEGCSLDAPADIEDVDSATEVDTELSDDETEDTDLP